jgi:Bacterial pre-peptidase C-terminal domain
VPGNWRFPGFITPDSFDASGNINYPVSIGSGKNIRMAIAWDSTAACSNLGTSSQSCASDVLNADLDLYLVNPSGVVVATSSSFQNSAEVIDYKTTTSGTYTIRVNKFRFDAGTNTYLGVAWNLNTVDSRTPLTGVTSFTLNTTKTSQTTDKGRSFWDTYSGPATSCTSFLNTETGLEKVYQITTPSTGKITATLSNIVKFTGVNSDVDVIILKKSGSANSQNTQVVGCGETTAVASNQPAGTYYIVVDGSNGSVAKFSLTVNFTPGTAVAAEELALDMTEVEPLPQR